MGVYSGSDGSVTLTRRSDADSTIVFQVAPDGVSTANRRLQVWTLDGELIPGDRIKITGAEGALLSFIANENWQGGTPGNVAIVYVWPDEAGGIRLFNTYDDAVNANQANALTLAAIGAPIVCSMQLIGAVPRLVAQVTRYSFRTGKEQIDTTSVGEVFSNAYGSRISGQGDLTAQFDYSFLDDGIYRAIGDQPGILFAQMILRAQVGANFDGQFVIVRDDSTGDPACWYEATCALTDVGIQQVAEAIIELAVSFITLDDIKLRVKSINASGGLLLQEQTGEYVLEDDSGSLQWGG